VHSPLQDAPLYVIPEESSGALVAQSSSASALHAAAAAAVTAEHDMPRGGHVAVPSGAAGRPVAAAGGLPLAWQEGWAAEGAQDGSEEAASAQRIPALVSQEDLRRRRTAAALAEQAQAATLRVTEWQSKFAG
jgi:hypothetical protein